MVSFERSEHIFSLIIISYDGFVPCSILVDLAIGLDGVVERQVGAEDGDVPLAEEGVPVDSGSNAKPEIFI